MANPMIRLAAALIAMSASALGQDLSLWRHLADDQEFRERAVPLVVSADGKLLVLARDREAGRSIATWDLQTGKKLADCAEPHACQRLAISPDGSTVLSLGLAGAGDSPSVAEIKVWNARTGELKRRIELASIRTPNADEDDRSLGLPRTQEWDVQFSADGTAWLVGHGVRKIDIDAGVLQLRARGEGCVMCPRTGRVFNGDSGWGFFAGLKEVRDKTPIVAHTRHGHAIGAGFDASGKNLATLQWGDRAGDKSDRPHVLVWDFDSGKVVREHAIADLNRDNAREIGSAVFSPDGRFVAFAKPDGRESFETRIIDTADGASVAGAALTGVRPAAFAPNGMLILRPMRGPLRFFDPGAGTVLKAPLPVAKLAVPVKAGPKSDPREPEAAVVIDTGIEGGASAVAVSDDGRLVIVQGYGKEGNVQIWDVTKKTKLHSFNNESGSVLPTAISPDGRFAAYAGYWSVRVVRVDSGAEMHRLRLGGNFCPDLFWSRNGGLLAAVSSKTLSGWAPRSGEKQFEWQADEEITGMSNLFDRNRRVAVVLDKSQEIRIVEVDAQKSTAALKGGHTEKVNTLAVTEDGKTLISSDIYGTVAIWDVAAGKVVRTFKTGLIWRQLILLPGDTHFAYTTDAHDIVIESVADGKRRARLRGHTDNIWSLAVTADGSTLVSGADDKKVMVWNLKSIP